VPSDKGKTNTGGSTNKREPQTAEPRQTAAGLRGDRIERASKATREKNGRFVDTKPCAAKKRCRSRRPRICDEVAPAYPWGKKAWLKRREVTWEYGVCSRTIRRAELKGHLNPSILFGENLYRRDEIEDALEMNRLRLPATGGAHKPAGGHQELPITL
jgi:hypothetical protein